MTRTILHLALAAAFITAPAHAGGPRTEKVSYGDLDLTVEKDIAVLDGRISDAVTKLCMPTYKGGEMPFEYVRRCGIETRASIVEPRAKALAMARSRQTASTAMVVGVGD